MKKYIVTILIIAGFALADNFVTNGDFEQELSVGWQQMSTGSGYTYIERGTGYNPDPDYEARVWTLNKSGYADLYQVINIPDTDIEFSCGASFYAHENSSGGWSAAAVVVSYMNASDAILGETRIYQRSNSSCPWADSPILHLIEVTDYDWHTYSFNLNDELTNLSGINPLEVSKIQIALFDTSKLGGG